MFCNQCGRQIPDGSRFCNFCGANLTAVQATPVQNDPYFDIRHGVLVKYKGREKNVVVPAGVVEIEEGAFTGYDMESVTIPEGCRKVVIPAFVNLIRFPSTIEYFYILVGKKCKSTVGYVYFAPGTKVIDGAIGGYLTADSEYATKVRVYIPDSVVAMKEISRNHYFEGIELVYDDIDRFPLEVRKVILRCEGRCQYCGGSFKTGILGKTKCQICGRKKDYEVY